jgi:hypothetical protein
VTRDPRRPAYVDAIGAHLRDVPWAQREALLDDVATHLADAQLDPEDLALWTERFGSPQAYAASLRADLGLRTDEVGLHKGGVFWLRHARLRVKLLAAAGAIAACTFVAAVVWVLRAQPLTFESAVTQFDAESIDAGGESEFRWRWSRGGQFAAGTWLHNDAAVAIRVTALDAPRGTWDHERVTLAAGRDLVLGRDRPFAPFTLAPGTSRLVWFRGSFTRCPEPYAPGSGVGISDIDATFEILGITRRATLALPFTYSVVLGDDCR